MGVRSMGMGGAFVGLADDLSASYWNPAGGAQLQDVRVTGMYGSLFNDKTRNTWIAFHVPTKEDIHLTFSYSDQFFTDTGGAREDVYTGSIAVPVTKNRRFMGGTSFRYMYGNFRFPGGTVRGQGVDLGLLYLLPLPKNKQLHFGLALTDLFTTVRYATGVEQDVPFMFTPGVAFKFDPDTSADLDFSWADTRQISTEDRFRFRGGLEHWFFNHQWGIRAGYEKYTTLPGQMAVGASYQTKKWAVDYAYGNHPRDLGNSHRISLSWNWARHVEVPPEEITPINLTCLLGDQKIYLSWELPLKARVEGYWVYYRTDQEKEFHRRRPDDIETNYCVLRGAANGVNYHIYVRLISAGKQGPPSQEVSVSPRPLLPEAKPFFDRGVNHLNSGSIAEGLAAARQAEQLDPQNYDIKELIRRLQQAHKEGLLKGP